MIVTQPVKKFTTLWKAQLITVFTGYAPGFRSETQLFNSASFNVMPVINAFILVNSTD